MTVGGYLGESFLGSEHAFEFFMFFGGLNLGLGLGRNAGILKGPEAGS